MKKEKDFRDRLEPFTELYTEMYSNIRKRLEAMTEDELSQILKDAHMPSMTNCGWTTSEAAKIVRDIAPYVAGIDALPQATESTEPAQAEE
jgi:hypothetical protein